MIVGIFSVQGSLVTGSLRLNVFSMSNGWQNSRRTAVVPEPSCRKLPSVTKPSINEYDISRFQSVIDSCMQSCLAPLLYMATNTCQIEAFISRSRKPIQNCMAFTACRISYWRLRVKKKGLARETNWRPLRGPMLPHQRSLSNSGCSVAPVACGALHTATTCQCMHTQSILCACDVANLCGYLINSTRY